ncbi:MAG TPA: HDOD domain-containing protein [Accumulibacter sp.]|nr:HDOD domain-containing protein [Accumulibacter sp.]HMW18409.1 HDOD domain-containing protein [Accumulibacter sp.]HMX22730.1 HDOD domain-containing protein [Accumulibacter sp.]HMY06032.1 HDOD domain-containing protein [Accumulibacter sp.]HNC18516.1 HDOD domain-containing protein [Accumulibacter sp.]
MNDPALANAYLFRQPIINREQALAGYQLTFGDDEMIDRSRAAGPLCAAYSELGLRSALGNSTAFIGIDADFLHQAAVELLPAEGVVLELMLEQLPDPEILSRCRSLRARGYSLAFSGYGGIDDRSRPLLPMIDIIEIDLRSTRDDQLSDLAESLRHLPIQLMAQNVDSREKMETCRRIGFDLFHGNYFAQPEIVKGRRLSPTQASLIQLINLLNRDAETTVIEDAFKHEPALTVNLLRVVNAVGHRGSRLAQPVTSVRHAITLLGRRQIQRWLSLLLLAPSGSGDPIRSPLLQVAALRGRMMELLIELSPGTEARLGELAFLTGVLSMLPAALGLPLAEILQQLTVEPRIQDALCEHRGLLGRSLALLECFDGEDAACCDKLLNDLPGHPARSTLNKCLGDALRWLNATGE